MKRSSAIISFLIVIGAVVSFFLPNYDFSSRIKFDCAIVQLNNIDRISVDTDQNIPAELLVDVKFDIDTETIRDFGCDLECSVHSGYYSKPFVLHMECEYDIYYTTDGTVPDVSDNKYDDTVGIPINDDTFLCICAEDNGKLSDIYYASYVIFKDITDYHYAYGFNSLNEKEKALYEMFYSKIESFDPDINIGSRGIDSTTIKKVLGCVNYDNPLLFQAPFDFSKWRGTYDNVTYVQLDYEFTKETCERLRSEVQKRVDDVFEKCDGCYCLMDVLERIHFQINAHAVYDDSDINDLTIYESFGVLINGRGVCESYSRAFQYFCQRMGLQSLLVVGVSDEIGHMWNMIKIEGDWYHIDLTWDDYDGYMVYDFFNVNDNIITTLGKRTISPPISYFGPDDKYKLYYNYYPIPKADSDKYNFGMYYYGSTKDTYYINDDEEIVYD